jgi:hypothetical protein
MNLAGAAVREEHVRLLATMVNDELAAKLERAITNNNTIIALSPADRQQLLAVFDKSTPGGLLELRNVLIKQGDHARRREAQADRQRRDQARIRIRNLGRTAATSLHPGHDERQGDEMSEAQPEPDAPDTPQQPSGPDAPPDRPPPAPSPDPVPTPQPPPGTPPAPQAKFTT